MHCSLNLAVPEALSWLRSYLISGDPRAKPRVETDLCIASKYDDMETMKTLLLIGTDVNAPTCSERPIHLTDKLETIKLLVSAGASIDEKVNGQTLLSKWMKKKASFLKVLDDLNLQDQSSDAINKTLEEISIIIAYLKSIGAKE